MKDYEGERVREALIAAVRLTPLDEDGVPRHRWAYTFRFNEPVYLAVARRTPTHSFGQLTRRDALGLSSSLIGAIIAAREPDDPDNVQALTYALGQRWQHGAAVETWTALGAEGWLYALIPAWYHEPDTGRWPLEEPDHREAHAVSKIRPVDTYPWPDPSPLPDDVPFTRCAYVMAITPTPPPQPGYAGVLAA